MMLNAPAGHDIMYDDSLCEQGRNFCNKIWNAFRLIDGWTVDNSLAQPEHSRLAAKWFEAALQATMAEVDDLMGKFRISEALMALYKLFWDEFSAWYLEIIKPGYQQPLDKQTMADVRRFFTVLLQLLHPFMPFITEELWQHISPRQTGESIMVSQQPAINIQPGDADLLKAFNTLKEIVAGVRTVRKQKQIPQKNPLELLVLGQHDPMLDSILVKMANLSAIKAVDEKPAMAAAWRVEATEYAIPLAGNVDVAEERAKLEVDLKRFKGFKAGVEKKLSNERFVANAPEAVVALERKKLADATAKIEAIEASLAALQ